MKTRKDIEELVNVVFKEIQATRESGQKEYAGKEDNAFRNFEEAARDLDTTREKVLWTFVDKHLRGIKNYLNGHKSQREDVRGRIKDVIVYLVLLWGMVDDFDSSDVRDFHGNIVNELLTPENSIHTPEGLKTNRTLNENYSSLGAAIVFLERNGYECRFQEK